MQAKHSVVMLWAGINGGEVTSLSVGNATGVISSSATPLGDNTAPCFNGFMFGDCPRAAVSPETRGPGKGRTRVGSSGLSGAAQVAAPPLSG